METFILHIRKKRPEFNEVTLELWSRQDQQQLATDFTMMLKLYFPDPNGKAEATLKNSVLQFATKFSSLSCVSELLKNPRYVAM